MIRFTKEMLRPKKRTVRSTQPKSGTREDLGIYVRSSWEANYARYLNFLQSIGAIVRWQYEPKVFTFDGIKRGTRDYTPDFAVWETEQAEPTYYVEIKGYMSPRDRTKLYRMRQYYPDIEVRLVQAREYREIQRKFSGAIGNWE